MTNKGKEEFMVRIDAEVAEMKVKSNKYCDEREAIIKKRTEEFVEKITQKPFSGISVDWFEDSDLNPIENQLALAYIVNNKKYINWIRGEDIKGKLVYNGRIFG